MRNGRRAVLLVLFLCVSCAVSNQKNRMAETRLQLGLAWLAQRNWAAAELNFKRAQQQNPADYRIWLAQAQLWQAQNETERARWFFRKALKMAPDSSYALNNYGAFLCRLGQYDMSHQLFKRAAQSHQQGSRADSLENSGYCYLAEGEFKAARQALQQAIKIEPEKRTSLLAEIAQYIGQQEWAKARLLLDTDDHSFPASAESLWLNIRFAARQQHIADFQRYALRLMRDFPQSIQYQRFLANEY